MSYAEENIINTYTKILSRLSSVDRITLINRLNLSLKHDKNTDDFFNSFGAFPTEKTAEEIITDIKSSRKFRNKELTF